MIQYLPLVNALLNATSTVFLITGVFFILRKQIQLHQIFLLSALFTSTLFLVSYLVYHIQVYSTESSTLTYYRGEGFLKSLYLFILFSHMVLAVVVPPLAGISLWRAFRKNWEKHKKIARWTFPIWLYVSLTGVLIYLFLYLWNP